MSSRNIGLSIGHAATKANGGTPGTVGFGGTGRVGAGTGGSGTVVTMTWAGEHSRRIPEGYGPGDPAGGDPGPQPMTERDLPPPDTKRWVMRRKAEVVAGVRCGLITLDEACRRYTLSVEEFLSWQRLIDSHGVRGLRATRLQDYRGGGTDDGDGRDPVGPRRDD